MKQEESNLTGSLESYEKREVIVSCAGGITFLVAWIISHEQFWLSIALLSVGMFLFAMTHRFAAWGGTPQGIDGKSRRFQGRLVAIAFGLPLAWSFVNHEITYRQFKRFSQYVTLKQCVYTGQEVVGMTKQQCEDCESVEIENAAYDCHDGDSTTFTSFQIQEEVWGRFENGEFARFSGTSTK